MLTVLALTNLISYAARNALVGVYPTLRAEFGVTNAELGLLNTAFILPHALATLPYGWAGDRFDRRRVIALGMVIASLGGAAAAIAPDYLTLNLTRAFVGLGTAAVVPVANSVLAQVFPGPEKARRMSLFNLGLFLGGVLGISLGPKLDFPGIVFAFAIPGIAVSAVIAAMPIPAPRSPDARSSFGNLTLGFIADARSLLRIRTLRWVIASATTMAFAAGALGVWLKDFLEDPSGKSMSQTESTTLLGVSLVGGLAGIITGGQVSDRLSKRHVAGRLWTIVLGMTLTVPCGVAALQLPPGVPLYIASIGTMFFISWYHAPMAATVDDLAPPGKTVAAQGLVIFTMHMLGTSPSAWLVGLLSDYRHSLYDALWLPTGLVVVAAFCMAMATRSFAADARRAL
nr:MFS transporter [Kofleriaceae bacterium]